MTLETLASQLRTAIGDASLRAVVLYGSAAGGEQHGKHSDRNVLVVVRDFGSERLLEVGAVTRAWAEGGDPPLLILTEAEWRSSVDIFAIEHGDVRARHRVLFCADGYDPFAEPAPDRAEARRQLEYEAMALLLRLRSAMLTAGRDGARATKVLTGSLGSVLALFRAAVRLQGGEPSGDSGTLCKEMAATAGFDATPFVAVLGHRRSGSGVSATAAPGILEGYHRGMQQFVAWVDALPPTA